MNCDCIYYPHTDEASLMANGRHSFVAFYPSDWLAGTARLPRLHRSVFFDVCCYIWDTAKPVPARELTLMIGDLPDGQGYIDDLIAMGKLARLDDGSISNAKALAEGEKAFDLWQRKSDGGRAARSADKSDDKTDVTSDLSVIPQNQNQNQNQNQTSPKKEKRAVRGTALPRDFVPRLTVKAQEHWGALDNPERELQQFKDHHTAKGSVMKDWQAAFRTWLSNAVKYQEKSNGRGKRSGWLPRR